MKIDDTDSKLLLSTRCCQSVVCVSQTACGWLFTRQWTRQHRPSHAISRKLFLSREQRNPTKCDYTMARIQAMQQRLSLYPLLTHSSVTLNPPPIKILLRCGLSSKFFDRLFCYLSAIDKSWHSGDVAFQKKIKVALLVGVLIIWCI